MKKNWIFWFVTAFVFLIPVSTMAANGVIQVSIGPQEVLDQGANGKSAMGIG